MSIATIEGKISDISVSVCFPAYNEEATIAQVLEEAYELLSKSGLSFEILVCNDGSVDRTGTIIQDLAKQIPRLRVLDHPQNLGISRTFEHLYAEAVGDLIFLNSTDRQWETGILFQMMPMTKDWDVIVASRVNKHYGTVRRFVSWSFNLIPRLLFGVDTYDAGAVKLMRREIIHRFKLESRSPFTEAERLIRAARAGYRITEYSVEINTRKTGRSHGVSVKVLLEALADVIRLWWSLRSNRIEVQALSGREVKKPV